MIDADQAFNRYFAGRKPEDLARVFDVCAPQLLLLANHIVGDGGAAEDVVQLTFLRAIEGVDKFEAGRPVRPWLVGILVREAKQHRRQAGRSPDQHRLVSKAGEPVPTAAAELREFEAALATALDELPQAYREVVSLRLIHGLTPTEIAHVRGVSPQTIKTQLRRGTERLRRLLPVSFASALIPLATTAYLLAASRKVVLEAAEAAYLATAAATTAAAATATEVAEMMTASLATAAPLPLSTAPTAAAVTATRALSTRRLAWAVGTGGALVLGGFAFQAFDDEPTLPPTEHRVLLEPPKPVRSPMRASVTDATDLDAPEADLPLASFTGRIVDHNRLGIEGLAIEILRLHADALIAPAARLPRQTEAPRLVTGTTHTDQIGRFSITGVPPSGTFILVIDAGGPRVDLRLIDRTPEPRERIELGELELGPPHLVRGRLVDGQGDPIAGARLRTAATQWRAIAALGLAGPVLEQVCSDEFDPDGALVLRAGTDYSVLTIPPWFRQLYQRLLGRTVTTDADGRFTWVTSRPGPIEIAIAATGFAPQRFEFDVRLPDVDIGNLEFRRVGGVGGIVLDEQGDPAAQAEVMLCHFELEANCMPAHVAAVTDAEGRFHAPWEHRHQLLIAIRRGPTQPWHVVGVRLPGDRLTVALPRRFDVVVHVGERHGAAHTPARARPDLRLVPGRLDPDCPLGCLTLHQLGFLDALDLRGRRRDPKPGQVELQGVPPGDWVLLASMTGHETKVVPLEVDGVTHTPTIELTPLEPTTIALANANFGHLDDLPVFARAEVADGAFEFPVLLGRTDAEGMLRLLGSRWRRQSIGTNSNELGFRSSAAAGADQIAISIPRRGVIEGQLTENGKLAAPGSWMLLARPSFDRDAPPATVPRSVVMCPVGDHGRFRFPGLEPGKWDIRAVRPRSQVDHPSQLLPLLFPDATDRPQLEKLQLVARGHEQIRLEAVPPPEPQEPVADEPAPTTIRGTVRPSRPVYGTLQIGIERAGRWSWFATDADGVFDTGLRATGPMRMAVLAAGAERVETGTPEEYLWLAPVQISSTAVFDLELPVHLMTFTMTTSQRRDHAEGLEVRLQGSLDPIPGITTAAPKSWFSARTDHGGWFRIDLPAGNYAVHTEHPLHGWLQQELRVEFPHSKSYRLAPLLVAAGRALTTEIGIELPTGSKVKFVRIDGGLTRVGRFAPRRSILGRPPRPFRVEGLLPGRYRVSVHASTYVNGRMISPERTKIVVEQGIIELGTQNRIDLVLRQPSRAK